jgi:hypothetical protein
MRSEYAANIALCINTNQTRIGANFSAPAPVRASRQPTARMGYVLTLCVAIVSAIIIF